MAGAKLASLGVSLLVVIGVVTASARDERRGEHVSGDADPVIVPRSVAQALIDPDFDPEVTGSTNKRRAEKRYQACDRFKFYPERPLERQFEQAC
jgi:hypothetical protein